MNVKSPGFLSEMPFPPNLGSKLLKIMHKSFHPRTRSSVPHMDLRRTNLRHRPRFGRQHKHLLSEILKMDKVEDVRCTCILQKIHKQTGNS